MGPRVHSANPKIYNCIIFLLNAGLPGKLSPFLKIVNVKKRRPVQAQIKVQVHVLVQITIKPR